MLGNYELLQPLGRGGMAQVHQARRRGPAGVEKLLVIKRIRRESASDPRFVQLFIAEAKLSMSFTHKNIVSVFDFGRVEDELFLVMEFVDGADLHTALHQAGDDQHEISALTAAYIANETCQALSYVHSRQGTKKTEIVHRDVTPKNVLLSRNGEVKLADFGVAIANTNTPASHKTRGTPAYMAPEQAAGAPVDQRTDVFALGLLLWEMLAGRPARVADSPTALLQLARDNAIPQLRSELPSQLREIVSKATAMDPDDRYQSAQAMQLALDDFIVSARAADRDLGPPAHALALLIEDVSPAASPDSTDTSTLFNQPAITYLEDGESALASGATDPRSRSQAATVVDATVDATGDSPQDAGVNQKTNHRWRGRLVALGVMAIAAAVVLWWVFATAPSQDARSAASRPTHPALMTDAARVDAGGGAAPISRAAPDAAKPRRPDAAPTGLRLKRASRLRKPASAPNGTLEIGSNPWARVVVSNADGKTWRCPETPCTLHVPPGEYSVRLKNPIRHLAQTRSVTVVSKQSTRVRASLTRPDESAGETRGP